MTINKILTPKKIQARTVFDRLRSIRSAQKQNESNKKKGVRKVKRVDLRNVNNGIPSSPPFPFMVDSVWHDQHVKAKGLTCEMREEDPAGFGDVEDNENNIDF